MLLPKDEFFFACEKEYGGYHYESSSHKKFQSLTICTRYSTFKIKIENSNYILMHRPNYARRYHYQLSSVDLVYLIWYAYTHDYGKYTERKIFTKEDYSKFLQEYNV